VTVTLQEQLADLREARATGARQIRFRDGSVDKLVEYRTDAELAAAIADLERRIAAQTRTPVRVTYIRSSKGL
jgi:hypothetical protein